MRAAVDAGRRSVVVLATAVAVLLAGALPAWGSWTAERAAQTTVATATVAAPGGVTVSVSSCFWFWFTPRISWTPSGSRDVVGYRITAYTEDGRATVMGETTAGELSYRETVMRERERYWFTVTTVTGYGWTAESPRVGPVTC